MELMIDITKVQISHVIGHNGATIKEIQNETGAAIEIVDGPKVKITGDGEARVLAAENKVREIIANQESPDYEGPEGKRLREEADALGANRALCFSEATAKRDAGDHAGANKLVEEAKLFSAAMEARNEAAAAAIAKYNNEDKGRGEDCFDMHGLREKEAIAMLERRVARLEAEPMDTVTVFAVIAGAGHHSAPGRQKLKGATEEYFKRNGITYSEEPIGTFTANILGKAVVNAACGQEIAGTETESASEEEMEIEPSGDNTVTVIDEYILERKQWDRPATELSGSCSLFETKPSSGVISEAVYDSHRNIEMNDMYCESENDNAVINSAENSKTIDASGSSCGIQTVSKSDDYVAESSCESKTNRAVHVHVESGVDENITTKEKTDEHEDEYAVEMMQEEEEEREEETEEAEEEEDNSCAEEEEDSSSAEESNMTDENKIMVDTDLVDEDEDEDLKESINDYVQEQEADTGDEEKKETQFSAKEDMDHFSHTHKSITEQLEEMAPQKSVVLQHTMPEHIRKRVRSSSSEQCSYLESNEVEEVEEEEKANNPTPQLPEPTMDEEKMNVSIKEVPKENTMIEYETVMSPIITDSHLEEKIEEITQSYQVPVHEALNSGIDERTACPKKNKGNKMRKIYGRKCCAFM